ncbi:hypothetical protein [Candidatus Nitrosocosmicus franklandus]|uniref:Uncharacterized protein n=1 Tax=Candidatus Nitrosocosmicus franklandianus TaxID=1798806 RepID=A0A484IAW0_9ARCH|nr:hypothetical protein [Candidatus Nitrosocosmicus franklandus]VFJ14892.1 protein of unknown function [Candidatus Nitrosocosmicus franklandus]
MKIEYKVFENKVLLIMILKEEAAPFHYGIAGNYGQVASDNTI